MSIEENQHIHEGGCACGEIHYELTSDPMFVNCCHCRWCQRESGSAFALNAIIETSRVDILKGKPEAVKTPTESGMGQTYFRCPTCKVALWSHYARAGDKLSFIRVGSLKEPERISPNIHIFTSSKLPWVTLSGEIPIVPDYYDRNEYWPAASLARRKAALSL